MKGFLGGQACSVLKFSPRICCSLSVALSLSLSLSLSLYLYISQSVSVQLSLVGVVAFFWVLKSSTSFLVTCLGLLFGHVYHVKSPAMQKFCVSDRPPLAC